MSEAALVEALASLSGDPLGFVYWAFPWGKKGTLLANHSGPEDWQADLLIRVREGLPIDQAIRIATASGHGVGKSALCSWLIIWALSTREDTKGVVTANTETQLKTKTWAELGRWYNLFIAKSLFTLSPTAFYSADKARERTWRIDMIPWSERNTEAFAGLHNQGNRILVLFDEASAIPDIIWEVAEGALTDQNTQIIWAVFGNPTRNSGRFKACFDSTARWAKVRVDSREVSFTNKTQIANWLAEYGDDSDFARIRVKGQFPRTGEMEFFTAEDIDAAMARESGDAFGALVLGVDVARFGANASVIFPRRGRDARTVPRRRFQGLSTVALAQEIQLANRELRADGILIDEGGVGGGVVDQVRHLQLHCFGIHFAGKPIVGAEQNTLGERYANMRASMYGQLRAWMRGGSIPNDPDLKAQLLSISYTHNNADAILLTSKDAMIREGKASPDDIDALALTFAIAIEPRPLRFGGYPIEVGSSASEYHPYAGLGSDYNPMNMN